MTYQEATAKRQAKRKQEIYDNIRAAIAKSDTGRAVVFAWHKGEFHGWYITADDLDDAEYMKTFSGIRAAVHEYAVKRGDKTSYFFDPPAWLYY